MQGSQNFMTSSFQRSSRLVISIYRNNHILLRTLVAKSNSHKGGKGRKRNSFKRETSVDEIHMQVDHFDAKITAIAEIKRFSISNQGSLATQRSLA